ncbi:hypothetical protein Acj9p036 [Acinetobacter phage Acj9]|uniref:Uncharacterized protein n=1 Tax=Acinetobacter phage Acj9 TaxID=760939 RepID=E5EPH0_9CAUD|nr:hypothetical protein Acj9p036 [Acinetobacter phage Acj9]ADG59936.1 hypothetical protein Acj9p036 [Acinetobacter phage Acj9]
MYTWAPSLSWTLLSIAAAAALSAALIIVIAAILRVCGTELPANVFPYAYFGLSFILWCIFICIDENTEV